MRRWLCWGLLVWFGGTALANEAARTTVGDATVGFSYSAPSGWSSREFPGLKSPIAFGTPDDGFAPNINVVEEAFSGSLDDYVQKNLGAMEKVFPNFKNLGASDFQTDSGLKGRKISCQDTQQGKPLRQIFYFFPGRPGKMLVVTCSTLDAAAPADEPQFESALKSFTVQR